MRRVGNRQHPPLPLAQRLPAQVGHAVLGGTGRLVETTLPSGYCTPSVPAWNSPIGFTTDWYANQGTRPATITSLKLLGAHDLVLHGAVLYEMEHSLHTLTMADPWPKVGTGSDPRLWARRQPIPGAVIPPGHAKYALIRFSKQDNLYVIAEDVTATSRQGGWALGQIVTYISGGTTYTVESHSGVAIGAATLAQADASKHVAAYYCDAAEKAFQVLGKKS
jgi:hypothetical protein